MKFSVLLILSTALLASFPGCSSSSDDAQPRKMDTQQPTPPPPPPVGRTTR